MSKDQKETKKLLEKDVNKLQMACRMILEIESGLEYWNFNQVWPINLYSKTLHEIVVLLNQVIFSNDFSEESNRNFELNKK